MNRVLVKILPWTIGAWICTVGLVGFAIFATLAKAFGPAILFVTFAVFAGLLIWRYGPIELTHEEISMMTPAGKFGLRWAEVQAVEFGSSHLVLNGENKRLVVPHPMFWTGRQKVAAAEILSGFFRDAKITPFSSFSADFKLSKNAKTG
jgi:hypothetical protein